MTRINSLNVQHLDQGGLDQLASTYGSVERLLSTPAEYAEVLPGLADGPQQPQPQSAETEAQQEQRDNVAALLQHICQDIAPQVSSGTKMLARLRSHVSLLPTGCSSSVDRLLRGGVRQGFLVEVAGETASGKTQLCLMAAVNAASIGYRVLYLDTTNSFCAARAQQLSGLVTLTHAADGTGPMTDTELLAAISVVRVHSIHALLSSLDQLLVSLGQVQASPDQPHQSPTPALLVIDSISAVLSPVLGGQQHHQGQTLVACVGRLLRQLADSFNVAVLVTNHVVSAGSGSEAGYKPALGELWRTQAHVRLQVSRGAGDVRHVALTSSSMDACPHQAPFNLSDFNALPP